MPAIRATPDGRTAGAAEMFQLFRTGLPRTRAELVETTGLARSTVGIRLESLLAARLVVPADDAASSGGRPPSQFALNRAAFLVAGIDVGATHATAAISDLSGRVLATEGERRDVSTGPEATLDWIAASITRLMAGIGRDPLDILAVGIGLPGPVEHESGRPVNPPIMPGWNDADVPAGIRERLGITAIVDNDVNMMAVGERTIAWPDVDDLLFIKIATGIGAGIISGRSLQRGAQGVAGDIGHVSVPRGAGIVCRCGNDGCLEALAAGPAVAATVGSANTAELLERLRMGDAVATRAVRQAGRDIGHVLSVAISMINPSVIALGGSFSRAGDVLLAGVREAIYARSAPIATEHLTITESLAGEEAAIIGACTLAIEHALSAANVETLLASTTMEA